MLSDKEKTAFRNQVKSNQHEIFIASIEEMDAILRSSPKAQQQAVQRPWQAIKAKAEASANYYATAADLRKLSKLVGDLGSANARVYVKTYGGKPHIILKGHPGLRRVLTGTKYGIQNPKVIAMGLGRAAATSAAKSGGIVTIVLLTGYRIADYVLTDEATLSRLIGSLATDVVKVGLATGASIAAATFMGAAFTLAIGPLAAVIGVGILTAAVLNAVDEHFGLTDKLVVALDELGGDMEAYYNNRKKQLERKAGESVGEAIDYAMNSVRRVVIDLAKHQLSRILLAMPRVTR